MISYFYFNLSEIRFLISFEVFYSKNHFYYLCNISLLTSPYLFLKSSTFIIFLFLTFLLLYTDQSVKWNFRKRWTHCSSILSQHSVCRITLISISIKLLPFGYTQWLWWNCAVLKRWKFLSLLTMLIVKET